MSNPKPPAPDEGLPMTADVELAGGAEQLFRAVFQLSQDAIGVSRNGTHVLVNASYVTLFGYAHASELVGRPILDLIAPEEHAVILERVRRRTQGGPMESAYETRGLRRDGTTFDLDVHVASHVAGTTVYTLVILRDVSEQKRARADAEERSAFYKAIFDRYPLPKFLVDVQDGRLAQVNAAAAAYYGYREQELTGMPISNINLSPREHIEQAMELAMRRQRNVFRFRHRLAGGELRDVDVYSSPMDWNGRTYLLSSVQDVTERTRLEEQLRQAQKMEAVGQLSGAIAHDFNNLLTNIMGFASLIQEDVPPDSASRRHADQIIRTSNRAAELTRQLLAFSRRQVLQPQVLSLNHLLMDMEVLLKHAVGERVRLQWDLAPEAGNVCADPTQLQQVVMNLVVNARDAMPRGGTLTLGTFPVDLSNAVEPVGPAVVLRVQDTGTGMDAATLSRIFEPFFTTKGRDRGTGLGLSTVYGIVRQSGGAVTVDSEPGKGARFEVVLPQTPAPLPERDVPGPSQETALAGRRVLVVEDQQHVRAFLVRGLTGRGCTVLEAVDGAAALAVLEAGPVDAMVTDVVMPGMSGVELVARARALFPGLPVAVISGDPAGLGPDLPDDSRAAFLAKPFTVHQLAAVLGRVLAR